MNRFPHLAALAASLLASAAFAQAPPPLNLKLPANSAPAASVTASTPRADPPGTFYGDTSGRMGDTVTTTPACDDSTYNKPQVHGSVGTGVMSGNHVGGAWTGGIVNISQAFGSCDDPGGGVSISVSGNRGRFHGR